MQPQGGQLENSCQGELLNVQITSLLHCNGAEVCLSCCKSNIKRDVEGSGMRGMYTLVCMESRYSGEC